MSTPGSVVESGSGNTLQLDWTNEDGTITVTPKDQDRFCVKVKRAIVALQAANHEAAFREQLNMLMKRLAQWIHQTPGIERSLLTIRDGAFCFVVIRRNALYDPQFEDSVSELDQLIAVDVDLNLIKLHCIVLPSISEESLASFVDQSFVMRFNQPNVSGA